MVTLAFSGTSPAELIERKAVSSTICRVFVLAYRQPSALAGFGGF